jgi:hypothetical protein
MDKVERIAVLRNEIEAQLLAGELAELDIPHLMKRVYQFSKGWGHIEAPSEFRDKILEVLTDLRQGSLNIEDESTEDFNDDSV